MGDAADWLMEREMEAQYEREWCEIHQCWFVKICTYCEDGEPGIDKDFPVVEK